MSHRLIWLDAYLTLTFGRGLPARSARAGQALSEYGTVLAVIVGVALLSMIALGSAVNGVFGDMATEVTKGRNGIGK